MVDLLGRALEELVSGAPRGLGAPVRSPDPVDVF